MYLFKKRFWLNEKILLNMIFKKKTLAVCVQHDSYYEQGEQSLSTRSAKESITNWINNPRVEAVIRITGILFALMVIAQISNYW